MNGTGRWCGVRRAFFVWVSMALLVPGWILEVGAVPQGKRTKAGLQKGIGLAAESADSKEKPESKAEPGKKQPVAVIETRLGTIVFKFFPTVAPKHVENFIKLAKEGFYDGTTFHRVIPGFMIQGGCPFTKSDPDKRELHGTGGPGYTLKAEFNDLQHKRGIVSMARSQNPDSAGSQFFICVADSDFLNGQYTIFGKVIEGMEVADKIVNEKRDARDNPLEPVQMKVHIEER